jgi:hypothetical protein
LQRDGSIRPGFWQASSRGVCLITGIDAQLHGADRGVTSYSSSGTSYSNFIIQGTQTDYRVWSDHELAAENAKSKEGKSPGFYIVNKTRWPVSVALEQVGCLYYGTIKPNEAFDRNTGAVWFTIKANIQADGKEPRTDWDCVKPVAVIVGSVLAAAATGGYGAFAAAGGMAAASASTVAIAAGTAAATPLAKFGVEQTGKLLVANSAGEWKGQYAGPEWPFRCDQKPTYVISGGWDLDNTSDGYVVAPGSELRLTKTNDCGNSMMSTSSVSKPILQPKPQQVVQQQPAPPPQQYQPPQQVPQQQAAVPQQAQPQWGQRPQQQAQPQWGQQPQQQAQPQWGQQPQQQAQPQWGQQPQQQAQPQWGQQPQQQAQPQWGQQPQQQAQPQWGQQPQQQAQPQWGQQPQQQAQPQWGQQPQQQAQPQFPQQAQPQFPQQAQPQFPQQGQPQFPQQAQPQFPRQVQSQFPQQPQQQASVPRQPDLMAFVPGVYRRNPTENAWHIGSIMLENGRWRWANSAGAGWSLNPDPANQRLLTGPENPYNKDGLTEFKLIVVNGRVTGFMFGSDVYTRQ